MTHMTHRKCVRRKLGGPNIFFGNKSPIFPASMKNNQEISRRDRRLTTALATTVVKGKVQARIIPFQPGNPRVEYILPDIK